jgi:hypothetical protein
MYMRLGELRRGSEVVRPILQGIGVRYPFSNAEAQLSLIGMLMLLRVRSRRPWARMYAPPAHWNTFDYTNTLHDWVSQSRSGWHMLSSSDGQ